MRPFSIRVCDFSAFTFKNNCVCFSQPLLAAHDGDKSTAPLHADYWRLSCLRNATCTGPARAARDGGCKRLLRCSACRNDEFACRLSGQCVAGWTLCDSKIDCSDGTDEIGCDAIEWRLWDGKSSSDDRAAANGSERALHRSPHKTPAEGRLQVKFLASERAVSAAEDFVCAAKRKYFAQGEFSDVCADGIEFGQADRLCARLGYGFVIGRFFVFCFDLRAAEMSAAFCRSPNKRRLRLAGF